MDFSSEVRTPSAKLPASRKLFLDVYIRLQTEPKPLSSKESGRTPICLCDSEIGDNEAAMSQITGLQQ